MILLHSYLFPHLFVFTHFIGVCIKTIIFSHENGCIFNRKNIPLKSITIYKTNSMRK